MTTALHITSTVEFEPRIAHSQSPIRECITAHRNGCSQRFLEVFRLARSTAHFALPGVDAFGESPVRGFRPFGGSLGLGCFGIYDPF
jgi:hypothetical protein